VIRLSFAESFVALSVASVLREVLAIVEGMLMWSVGESWAVVREKGVPRNTKCVTRAAASSSTINRKLNAPTQVHAMQRLLHEHLALFDWAWVVSSGTEVLALDMVVALVCPLKNCVKRGVALGWIAVTPFRLESSSLRLLDAGEGFVEKLRGRTDRFTTDNFE